MRWPGSGRAYLIMPQVRPLREIRLPNDGQSDAAARVRVQQPIVRNVRSPGLHRPLRRFILLSLRETFFNRDKDFVLTRNDRFGRIEGNEKKKPKRKE